MRLLTVVCCVIIFGGVIFADDPCKALDLSGTYVDNSGLGNGFCGQTPVRNAELIARVINNQKAETDALQKAIDGLTKAVSALDTTSKNLVTADLKWQKETLDKTIAAVDKIPATLAAQKNLQDVLIAAIKEQLLKDATFLDAVRKAP